MIRFSRRLLLTAGGTVAAGAAAGKLLAGPAQAETLQDMSALVLASPPASPPAITFLSPDGATHRLADYRGKGVVVNLWATWCAPCVAELPSLDRLAGVLGPDNVVVLPLSSDTGGAKAVEAFYKQHHIRHLPVLLDPEGKAIQAWAAPGIPLTILIDRQGRQTARLLGGAAWDTAQAASTVRKLTA